eukprot:TRINITY_DN9768_c0_g2_i1.p1 TRINITY_DN9768_c0_g2~~TRINITY_DN9768_c0_g2_i1.p1  ORF type:complete len:237 (-),score=2.40 TRINITY_DN9768_c0_g2_i1:95-805(-)
MRITQWQRKSLESKKPLYLLGHQRCRESILKKEVMDQHFERHKIFAEKLRKYTVQPETNNIVLKKRYRDLSNPRPSKLPSLVDAELFVPSVKEKRSPVVHLVIAKQEFNNNEKHSLQRIGRERAQNFRTRKFGASNRYAINMAIPEEESTGKLNSSLDVENSTHIQPFTILHNKNPASVKNQRIVSSIGPHRFAKSDEELTEGVFDMTSVKRNEEGSDSKKKGTENKAMSMDANRS